MHMIADLLRSDVFRRILHHRATILIAFVFVVLIVTIQSSITRVSNFEENNYMRSAPQIPRVRDFRTIFQNFDFYEYERSFETGKNKEHMIEDLVASVSEFAIVEPRIPIADSCMTAPPLPEPSISDCTSHPDLFNGKRARPAKIGHMIQFGFEVDVLEIHLRELYDVVDVFFILESTKAHAGLVSKPLVWDRIKHQSRFRLFHDKVVHLIVDDIDAQPASDSDKSSIWFVEKLQENSRFSRFLEWNSKQPDPFTDDDLIGFGDADEVAWRNNLNLLKHCALKRPVVDIGIWFPTGRVDNAFKTDWPVPGHPYTLGDPTFYTISEAKKLLNSGRPPTRNRGKSGAFLLGGMHMTRHRFLPYMVLQSLTCSECRAEDAKTVIRTREILSWRNFEEAEQVWDSYNTYRLTDRTVSITKLDPKEVARIHKIPWFLSCNAERYPYWWGKHDTRLDP